MARRTADRTDKDLAEVARAVGRQVQQSHSRSNRCLKGLLVIINCYYRLRGYYMSSQLKDRFVIFQQTPKKQLKNGTRIFPGKLT
jgi:hypothetical protein